MLPIYVLTSLAYITIQKLLEIKNYLQHIQQYNNTKRRKMLFSSKKHLAFDPIPQNLHIRLYCYYLSLLHFYFLYNILLQSDIIAFYIADFDFFFVLHYNFSFLILQFLTGDEPLGGYTVNKPLLLLLLLLFIKYLKTR